MLVLQQIEVPLAARRAYLKSRCLIVESPVPVGPAFVLRLSGFWPIYERAGACLAGGVTSIQWLDVRPLGLRLTRGARPFKLTALSPSGGTHLGRIRRIDHGK